MIDGHGTDLDGSDRQGFPATAVASIPPVMPDSFAPWDRPGPLEPASVAAECGLSLTRLAETTGLDAMGCAWFGLAATNRPPPSCTLTRRLIAAGHTVVLVPG